MTTTPVLFQASIDSVSSVLGQLTPDQWQQPTPCEGWTVTSVVEHVCGTLNKAGELMAGEAYAATPAAVSGASPEEVLALWASTSRTVSDTLATTDVGKAATGPLGTETVGDSLGLPIADLAVHAWDIATGAGIAYEIPADLIAHVRGLVEPLPEAAIRRPGVFGPAQPAPPDANDTETLVAWLGRRVSR